MDYSRMSRLILLAGYLWSLVASVVSVMVALTVEHGFAPHNQGPQKVIEWSMRMGFTIATISSFVGPIVMWGSSRIREQALRHYEESNGFPLSDEELDRNYSNSTRAMQFLTLLPFSCWLVGSCLSIYYLDRMLTELGVVNSDQRRVMCIGSQSINVMASISYVIVLFALVDDRDVVARARVTQPVSRASDAGQARQNENDEPMRHIAPNLRQRTGQQRPAGREVRQVQ